MRLSKPETEILERIIADPRDDSLRREYAEFLSDRDPRRSDYVLAELKWAASKRTRVSPALQPSGARS